MEKIMETPLYKVCYLLDKFMVFKFFKSIDDVADFIRGKADSVLEIKRLEKNISNIKNEEYEYND
jgi:hypothetical protein